MNLPTAVWIAVLTFVLPRSMADAPPSASELTQGVLARAEAIVSGRFEYTVTTGVGSTGKVAIEEHNEFTLSGPSWRVDYLDSHVQRINHDGMYLDVGKTPQADGSVYSRVRIESSQEIQKRTPHPPYFAGTLWYRTTIEYLREHSDEARLTGAEEVDGIEVFVLEWQVLAADRYRAFDRINSILDNGGVLRLYVASQLGYVLPRIEYIGTDERVAKRFDSSGFDETSVGLFFPQKCSSQLFLEDGSEGYYQRYEIQVIGDINQPIPEEDLVVSLPEGTVVTDRRTPEGADFRIGSLSGELPSDLATVIRTESNGSRRSWASAASRGVFAGLSVLLLLVVWYILRRRRMVKPE